jgi:hypothetical protein
MNVVREVGEVSDEICVGTSIVAQTINGLKSRLKQDEWFLSLVFGRVLKFEQ